MNSFGHDADRIPEAQAGEIMMIKASNIPP
jgi:hypothetical protein